MGVEGPEGVVTESSAWFEETRVGAGSGLALDDGRDPRLVIVIWLFGADSSASADSTVTVVIGAADGVCERSSVGCVASLR